MSKTPLYSIIVPIYKVEMYLRQCIDSLLKQDFDDYEIILVDDESPDNCPHICDEYARQYDNITVIHKKNGGLSDARNKGAEIAKGQYIIFVDSDDFWKDADVLSGVEKIINKYQPDIVVSDIIKYYTDSDKYDYPNLICDESYNGKSKLEMLDYLYFEQADLKISACQKFVRREYIRKFPFIKGMISEDIDWSLSLYPNIQSICVYDKPFYCYRQFRKGSITNTNAKKRVDTFFSIIDNWSTKIPSLPIGANEKEIYLGYLAYQLSVAMLVSTDIPTELKKSYYKKIKSYLYLFKHELNSKTKGVNLLINCFGVANTCRILKIFDTVRTKLHSHN